MKSTFALSCMSWLCLVVLGCAAEAETVPTAEDELAGLGVIRLSGGGRIEMSAVPAGSKPFAFALKSVTAAGSARTFECPSVDLSTDVTAGVTTVTETLSCIGQGTAIFATIVRTRTSTTGVSWSIAFDYSPPLVASEQAYVRALLPSFPVRQTLTNVRLEGAPLASTSASVRLFAKVDEYADVLVRMNNQTLRYKAHSGVIETSPYKRVFMPVFGSSMLLRYVQPAAGSAPQKLFLVDYDAVGMTPASLETRAAADRASGTSIRLAGR